MQISRTRTHNARNISENTHTQPTSERDPFSTVSIDSVQQCNERRGELLPIPPHSFRPSESHFKSKYDSSVLTWHERVRDRKIENIKLYITFDGQNVAQFLIKQHETSLQIVFLLPAKRRKLNKVSFYMN